MTGHSTIERLLRHPPGWPVPEAMVLTAAALLVVTLAVELGACLPF